MEIDLGTEPFDGDAEIAVGQRRVERGGIQGWVRADGEAGQFEGLQVRVDVQRRVVVIVHCGNSREREDGGEDEENASKVGKYGGLRCL